ncbi:MAG: YceI family protein [Acidobacteriia bacterium]|nr:YceI family protein [Terriglobia bacterium]
MATEKWNFDPVHSTIAFSVRHLMIAKVHGQFKAWTGSLLLDEAEPANSSVEVLIEAASVDTREGQRDDHLRSPDFLDAPKFPHIAFRSTKVEKTADDRYRVAGSFTIRDVTRAMVLEVEYLGRTKDPWGGERSGFAAKTSIDRKDYGLKFNMPLEGGGVLVGDRVDIALDIEAVKDTAAA